MLGSQILLCLKLEKSDKCYLKASIQPFYEFPEIKYKITFTDVLSFTSIGNLFNCLCFNSFLSSVTVSSYLFCGAKSILVTTMKKGIFKNKHNPMCYFVIFCIPMFAPTMTTPKSGDKPVRPLIVVLRYFS